MRTFELRYFASVREAIGKGSEARQSGARTVAELRAELRSLGEPYASALASSKRVRAAVNQTMVDSAAALPESGAEVAFFPPVTGG